MPSLSPITYLIVFVGSGLGGALRYGVGRLAVSLLGLGFPYGTLSINILGSCLMGMLAELFLVQPGISQDTRLFLTTGLMGGFTTFSTFSLDTVALWMRGEQVAAAAYLALSVSVSLAALIGGMALVRLGAQTM